MLFFLKANVPSLKVSAFFNLIFLTAFVQAQDLRDQTGDLIRSLPDFPKRVVTLSPSLSELAADFLGDQLDRLVGVSDRSDFPPGIKKIQSVGPFHRFNLEKLVSLRPDLVLATLDGNQKDQILRLKELGLKVVCVNTETFSEIENSMRIVSQALGMSQEGKSLTDRFSRGLKNIQIRVDGIKKKLGNRPLKVLVQVGDSPLVVVGSNTYLSEILKILQVSQIFAESVTHYPRPSIESVLGKNPDMIFILGGKEDQRFGETMAAKWRQFPKLSAQEKNQIFVVNDDSLFTTNLSPPGRNLPFRKENLWFTLSSVVPPDLLF